MTGFAPGVLSVIYATASAGSVAAFVTAQYDIGSPVSCAMLVRGFNDTYLVRTGADERFVLRLSGRRARGPADVESETAFLAYLDGAGVPVATPVVTRAGTRHATASLPDGPRDAVLFRYAEGRRPDLDAPEDARRQGVTLAQLHQAADRYPGLEAGRYRLDLAHLLHRPLAAILALDLGAPKARRDLLELAARLAHALEQIDPGLTRTYCHGDCHGLNARIAATGHAVFFDFDDGGLGYLAYDLAVHLWAQVSFGRRRHAMWYAFLDGYLSVRAIAPGDEQAIGLFVLVRHIWLMGEYAGRTSEWGSEILSAAWLEREVAFMLGWEQEKLTRLLL